MAAAGPRCTLVGFSTELDWRPLRFVQPIPPDWVCGACGLVRPVTARLACEHILCVSCYEQAEQGDARVCPLDGHRCLDEDVELQMNIIDAVLRNEVRCWNEQAGCDAVMAACDLGEHFRDECCHHATLCPKCSAPVLCADVHAHLTSECSAAVLPSSPADQRGPDAKSEKAPLTAFIGLLERRMAHIKSKLERILNDRIVHNQKLSDLCSSIEALKEEKMEVLGETSRQGRDYSAQNTADLASAAEREVGRSLGESRDSLAVVSRRINKLEEALIKKMKWGSACIRSDVTRNATKIDTMHSELIEGSREALYCLEVVTAQTSTRRAVYRFAVERISDLRADAARRGSTYFMSDRVYLRGYFMSTGVRLVEQEHKDTVSLHAWIQLHRGEYDDSLEWPLRTAVRFSAVHPDTCAEWVDNFVLPACGIVSRQETSQNEPGLRGLPPSFFLNELQRDGFVKDDRLLLKYELL